MPQSQNQYICQTCGVSHSDFPALTFKTPTPFFNLSEKDKEELAKIGDDFCVITYPDQTDRFIRAVLNFETTDSEEGLEYGVWISVSEKSFQDYWENFESDNHSAEYFGYLCNIIPEYNDSTMNIPTTVRTQKNGQRPIITPDPNFNHQLVMEFYNGITTHEAQTRVDNMLNS